MVHFLFLCTHHITKPFWEVPATFQRPHSESKNNPIWPYWAPGLQAVFICGKIGIVTVHEYLSKSSACMIPPMKNSTVMWRLRKRNLSMMGSPSPSSRNEILPTSNGIILVLNMLWSPHASSLFWRNLKLMWWLEAHHHFLFLNMPPCL